MQPDDLESNKYISIEDKDLPLEISITESDLQKGAAEYAKQNPDLIFPDQKDILPAENKRFYDKLRQSILDWANTQGAGGKYLEYILFAPDLFLLLVRLATDNRVEPKLKATLMFVAAYFVSPIDPMPEAILGPVGYLDDVVITSLAVLKLIRGADETIVREHWSGKGDIIAMINKVVNFGETLVGSQLWNSMKKRLGISDNKQ